MYGVSCSHEKPNIADTAMFTLNSQILYKRDTLRSIAPPFTIEKSFYIK